MRNLSNILAPHKEPANEDSSSQLSNRRFHPTLRKILLVQETTAKVSDLYPTITIHISGPIRTKPWEASPALGVILEINI